MIGHQNCLTPTQILKFTQTETVSPQYIIKDELQCGKLGRNIAYRLLWDNIVYEVSLSGIDESGQLVELSYWNRLFPFVEEAEQYISELRREFIV